MADNVANPNLPDGAAEPVGAGNAPPAAEPAPAAAAPAAPVDLLMALLQGLDQLAERAEQTAAAQQTQYNELRGLLNAKAAELAALRGGVPPPGGPPAPPRRCTSRGWCSSRPHAACWPCGAEPSRWPRR